MHSKLYVRHITKTVLDVTKTVLDVTKTVLDKIITRKACARKANQR